MRYIVLRKMTLNTILLMLSLFCVSSYAFLEHTSVSIAAFSGLKQPLLIMGAVFLVPLVGVFFPKLNRKGYLSTFTALFVLIVVLCVVMLMTKDQMYSDAVVRSTFRLVLYLADLFVLMVAAAEMGEGQRVLRFLFRYLLVLVLINDFLMFSGLYSFKSGRHESYLVGSKFSVSYLHMNLLALWVLNNMKKLRFFRVSLWKILLAAAGVIAVSVRINCMTGIVGCVALVALVMLLESPRRDKFLKFSSPWILLAALLCSVIFAFAAEVIMNLPFMRFIVEDVFKADTVAELAAKAGINAEALEATIATYNADCAAGKDSVFGRETDLRPLEEGPYYAIMTIPYVLITSGGPQINANAQMVNANGEVIPGAYLAGEIVGMGNVCGHTTIGGIGHGNCATWGMIAAENAVANAGK